MNKLSLLGCLFVAIYSAADGDKKWDDPGALDANVWDEFQTQHQGDTRTYFTYSPANGGTNGVVVLLHGAGGNELIATSSSGGYDAVASADLYGFTAVAPRGRQTGNDVSEGVGSWFIDGQIGNDGTTANEVTFVHNVVAEVMARGNLPSDAYKITIGFSNGAGLASLLICADYPIQVPWVAHVAGFIQDHAGFVYQNPEIGPYSSCASSPAPAPQWTAIGDGDFFIQSLTPTPVQGLMSQFVDVGDSTCPNSQVATSAVTSEYTCYQHSNCPSQYEMCVYNDLGHEVSSTMLVRAMDYLLHSSGSSSSPSQPELSTTSTLPPTVVISSTTLSPMERRKILCLHGGGGSPQGFANSPGMIALEAELPEIEFVYATSGYNGLWIRDPPGGKNEPTTDPHFADASLQSLDEIVASHGPFYGILGYSQGAAFVPVYLAHAPGTFDIAIMFCGYLTDTHQGLLGLVNDASPFGNIPSLIWMGANDPVISNAMSQRQATVFFEPTVIVDANGWHAVPDQYHATFGQVVTVINGGSVTSVPGSSTTSSAPSFTSRLLSTAEPTQPSGDLQFYENDEASCPEGAWVTNESDCRTAAEVLGLRFKKAQSNSRRVRGCYRQGRKVYFNEDQTITSSNNRRRKSICVEQ